MRSFRCAYCKIKSLSKIWNHSQFFSKGSRGWIQLSLIRNEKCLNIIQCFFLVSSKSLKIMCTCRNVIQFLFFMTNIYTWDPLSHSEDRPKAQLKRILVARQYSSKLQRIPITLEIHFLIHRTTRKRKWRGYSWF